MSARGHPVTNKVTDELIDLVKRLRDSGLKYTEITDQTGLSYPYIKKIQMVMTSRGLGKFRKYVKKGGNVPLTRHEVAKNTNVGRPKKVIVTEENKRDVQRLRAEGATYREVTEKTGLSYPIIKRLEYEFS